MNLKEYINVIQILLVQTHSELLDWFNEPQPILDYRPSDGGWTIFEILEHIALTSHYLLILIDKGAAKALKNINNLDLEEELAHSKFDFVALQNISQHKSFEWIRPEHMEPTGEKSELEIRSQLIGQLNRCLTHLENLKNGEGLLYSTTMTVDNLGKLNVYEYIYFLNAHAMRHLQQMDENVRENTASN